MADIDKRVRTLWSAMSQDGKYSGSVESFNDQFFQSGKRGYEFRYGIFKQFKDAGADVGKDYHDFSKRFGLHATSPKASSGNILDRVNKRINDARQTVAGVDPTSGAVPVANAVKAMQDDRPMTDAERRQMMQSADNIIGSTDLMKQQWENQGKYREQRTGLKTKTPVLGQNQNVVEQKEYNPETGEIEDTYLTSEGNVYANRFEADREQDAMDEYYDNVLNPDMTARQQASELEQELEDMYKDVYGEALEKSNTKYRKQMDEHPFLTSIIGAESGERGFDVNHDILHDPDVINVRAAQNMIKDALTTIREADSNKPSDSLLSKVSNFDAALTRGVMDKVKDARFYDLLGVAELEQQAALRRAAEKYDQGKKLTPTEEKLLEAAAVQTAVNTYYADKVNMGYEAGGVTAEMLPFAIEMALNPLSKSGTMLVRAVAKYGLKKYGAKAATKAGTRLLGKAGKALYDSNVGRKVVKGAVQLGGDMLGGGLGMATTTSLGKTLADTERRMTGDITPDTDESGRFVYGGRENQKELGEAFGEAVTANSIEHGSEMAGEYFKPVSKFLGSLISKGAKWTAKTFPKLHIQDVIDLVQRVPQSEFAKVIADYEKQAKWNGTLGEFAEEQIGGVMNALLVGDQTLDTNEDTGVFNPEQMFKTLVSVGILGGSISALKTLGYRTPKYQMRKAVDRAERDAVAAFSQHEDNSVWESIKEALNSEDYDAVAKAMADVRNNPDLDARQKNAVIKYGTALMRQKGAEMAEESRRTDPETDPVQVDAEASYDNGRTLETPEEKQDAKMNLDDKADALLQFADESTLNALDEDGIGTLKEIMARDDWSDEQKQAALDYVNAKATYEGMIDRVKDDIETEVADSDAAIDRRVASQEQGGDGMIHPATMAKDNRQVDIISGNVVMSDDGTMVDTQKSDKDIIVRDRQTGKVEFANPKEIKSVEAPIDAEALKASERERITNERAQAASNAIDGVLPMQQGDQYTLTYNGEQHQVQVVQDNGDGTVSVIIDGAKEPQDMAKEQLQDLANQSNRARLEQSRQQAQQQQAPVEETPTETPTTTAAEIQETTPEEAPTEAAPEEAPKLEGNGLRKDMPMREDGNPAFMEVSPERTQQFLYGEESGMTEDEAKQFVDNNIAAAEKAKAEVEKDAPKVGTDFAKFRAEKAAYQQQLDAAQAAVDYWNNVKAARQAATAAPVAQQAPIEQNAPEAVQRSEVESNATPIETTQETAPEASVESAEEKPTTRLKGSGLKSEEQIAEEQKKKEEQKAAEQKKEEEKKAKRQEKFRKRAESWSKKTGVKVNIIDNVDDVENAEAKAAIKKGRKVKGWWQQSNNEIYIYLPNMESMDDVDETFIHEAVAHRGLRHLLGEEEFGKLCDRVFDAMSPKAKARELKYVGVSEKDIKEGKYTDKQKRAAADEFMAKMSEHTDLNPTLWEQICNWIREALGRTIDVDKVKMSNESIQRLIRASYAHYQAEAKKKVTHEIVDTTTGEMEGSGETRLSVSSIMEGAGLEVFQIDEQGNKSPLTDDEGNVIARIGDKVFDGHHLLTVEDIESVDSTWNLLGDLALKAKTVSQDRLDEMNQKYVDIVNAFLVTGLAENGGAVNLGNRWLWLGETVFKTIAKNGDPQYSYSADITRVCKKNEAMIKAIGNLQEKLGYGITPSQIMDLYLETFEQGYQVPCPVCYVFSRYIRNGKYATAAIRGMRTYGEHLEGGKGKKWTAEQWQAEWQRLKDWEEEHSKEIQDAMKLLDEIPDRIDEIGKERLAPNTSAARKKEIDAEIKELDKQYRAAMNLYSQVSLSNWIKTFPCQTKGKGEKQRFVLRKDCKFPSDMADFESCALDLSKTAMTIGRYPAIQRLRKSGGSAAGKEITFASNNEMGEFVNGMGNTKAEEAKNVFSAAVASGKKGKEMRAATSRFNTSAKYAQQQSLRGGQRMWSWSDNLENLMPDVAINLMQLELVGGALQTYSKQLEGINMVARMGGYVNGSLMAKDNGWRELKESETEVIDGVRVLKDAITETIEEPTTEGRRKRTRTLAEKHAPVIEIDGKYYTLLLDDIIGVDFYGREENGVKKKGLQDLNKELDKAGNIMVGMNDIHVRVCLADNRIFFVIPWHASGQSVHILRQMLSILGTDLRQFVSTDYTRMQEEKDFSKKDKDGNMKEIPEKVVEIWESHKNETDYPSGIGAIESGRDGRISPTQLEYRALRASIFDGSIFKKGNEKKLAQAEADAFLSQVIRKMKERGLQEMTNGDNNFVYPYEYWDESSTYDTADVNGRRYAEYCRRLGICPKFSGRLVDGVWEDVGNFIDDKGYWKLLIDRRMYDTKGNFQDLTSINSDGFTMDLVDPEKNREQFFISQVAEDNAVNEITDAVREKEKERMRGKEVSVDYSLNGDKAVEQFNEVTRFREGDTFYSPAERAVENIKQEKATGEQWLKMIEKNGGLKKEEDKWMGLSDFLKDKKSLTKQEVLDFIRENQIQVEEVEYGNVQHLTEEGLADFEKLKAKFEEWKEESGESDAWYKLYEEVEKYGVNRGYSPDSLASEAFSVNEKGTLEIVNEDAAAILLEGKRNKEINSTRMNYTTEGLENKKEIALTVPTIESWNEDDEIHFGDAGEGRAVAWIRFGETTDADGNRVLVIDEIQSKRHQEGREYGYRGDVQKYIDEKKKLESLPNMSAEQYKRYRELAKIIRESDVRWARQEYDEFSERMKKEYGQGIMGNYENWSEVPESVREEIRQAKAKLKAAEDNASRIPDAPFQKNWHELAMKRMLRYAAENGYDKVAWTKGEQQAERYDLSKELSQLTICRNKNNPDQYTVIGYDKYGQSDANKIIKEDCTKDELANYIGKDLARQAIESADYQDRNADWEVLDIKGDNLRIGGEGMKGFYDQMLPRFMDKYGKKWGVKTGEVELPNVEEAGRTMWSVDVTPEMKDSVMEGQTMFRVADDMKKAQMDIISKNNPADESLGEHTWIKSVDDIKTFDEAMTEYGENENLTPDYTADMARKAKETGKITVYSSKPIDNGIFVTPSKMEAKNYAGEGEVYSKKVRTSDVAWIDGIQGQYAKVEGSQPRFRVADDITPEEAEEASTQFRVVDDPKEIERLEKEPKIKVYRAMQLRDGKLYPPMAAKVNGKWQDPLPMGEWSQADEHPELVDKNGKFTLDKGNGKKVAGVVYAPYMHGSTTMLNDQFKEAQDRPELVVVEAEMPESELTSGYQADKSPRKTGAIPWKAGTIQGQLTGTREVILSRWVKPVRIVPASEVAANIKEMIDGQVDVMPTNVVTPEVRQELEKLGVQFVKTNNQEIVMEGEHKGEQYSDAYGLNAKRKEKKARKNAKKNEGEEVTRFRITPEEDAEYMDAVEKRDIKKAQQMVKAAAKKAMPETKVVDEDGEPLVVYHGTDLEEVNGGEPFYTFYDDSHFGTWGQAEGRLYGRNAYFIRKNPKIYEVYLNLKNPKRVPDVPIDWEGTHADYWAQAIEQAKEEGYDGIVYKNEWEGEGDSYIAFNPNQIKSADAVTYDDNGKVIPLSERFNEENDDIRFRVSDERRRREYAERQWKRAHNKAANTIKSLGISDNVTVVDTPEELAGYDSMTEQQKASKGWYDENTGNIVVIVGNHTSPEDVQRTILREGVARYGLRQLFGQNYNNFLDNVLTNAETDIRREIVNIATRNGYDFRKATEEYLARLANDTDFERAMKQSWWSQIKSYFLDMLHSIGLADWIEEDLSDNELRYMLWRSYVNLTEPNARQNPFNRAREISMRDNLKVGDYSNIEDELPVGNFDYVAEQRIRKLVSEMPMSEVRKAYERINEKMRDEDGLDIDEHMEKVREDWRNEHGSDGIGKVMADDVQMLRDKYGDGLLTLRNYLRDRIENEGEVRFSIRGEKGAANDATAMANLDVAKEMEKAGEDTKKIWLATGWEKGKDGKWRNEIPDAKAKAVDPKKAKSIEDLVDAPELFEAYPELKEYKAQMKNMSLAGSVNHEDKMISLDTLYNTEVDMPEDASAEIERQTLDYIKNGRWRTAADVVRYKEKLKAQQGGKRRLNEEGLRTIIHEMQHAVQRIEGFAKGGNVSLMEADIMQEEQRQNPLLATFAHDIAGFNSAQKLISYGKQNMVNLLRRGLNNEGMTDEHKQRVEQLIAYLEGITEAQYKGFVKNAKSLLTKVSKQAKVRYNNLAGEVEARNTEKRSGMTDEERRETPLSATEDVKRDEQLIRFREDEDGVENTEENTEGGENSEENEEPLEAIDYNAGDMTLEEAATNALIRLAKQNERSLSLRIRAMHSIGGNLTKLRRAMAQQRKYDRKTVDSIVRLARMLMNTGDLNNFTRGEVKKLMSMVNRAAGKEDITKQADAVVDMMINHQLKAMEEMLHKQMKVKGSKLNQKGVEVQGALDITGQRTLAAFKDGIKIDYDTLQQRIEEAAEKMTSDNQVEADNARAEWTGYLLAERYHESILVSETEESNLRQELKQAKEDLDAGRMTREAYNEFVKTTQNAIRENRLERIKSYEDMLDNLTGNLREAVARAKEWQEKEQQRVEEIHHNANSDLMGVPDDEHSKPTWREKLANNSVLRFFMKPLANFDQILRFFGSKSVNGQGYLWNRFMGGFMKATDTEWRNLHAAHQRLDEKVSEVFGRDMRWSDLFAMERKMPTVEVEFWDGGEMKTHKLTQGNLLYIYMVNKMSDGQMKLRKMGITEDVMNEITERIDPRFKEIADWVQSEFLTEKRNEYNKVHERMFGASMASIDNYFPLKINSRSRFTDEEIGEASYTETRPSTITGSIVKRTRNSLALDITGADAFDVVLEHLQQMEHWAAFAEFSRDLNTLLSYRKFRNKVLNMSSVRFGSGKTLWNNFKDACAVAAGVYQPKGNRDSVDSTLVNVAKGVTGAKISLRVYTALKQFLSYPAYFSEASVAELAKSSNPYGAYKAWQWAMENLPTFAQRWQSRQAGDQRLKETDLDWGWWKNKVVEKLSRMGMKPNAFVDAITVSMGAKAIYETKKKRYISDGYSEEQAHERALRDAAIAFNETQQSSENAFLSAMQLDRTATSVALTVFRNSSMGYNRRFFSALDNLKRKMRKGYREESIAFMQKQLMRDGLSEEQAARTAKRMYNRSWYEDITNTLIFGFVMQAAWNIAPYLPYLIGGDDDDLKEKMLEDTMLHALAGGVEGLTAGSVISDLYNKWRSDEDLSNYNFNLLPLMSDIQTTLNHYQYDKVAAVNDVFNLLIQAGIGTNPQTITDAAVAILDACDGEPETSREAAMLIMRILQVPQSAIDNLYIDELGMSADKAQHLTISEMARRYAEYKRSKSKPLTGWISSDMQKMNEEDKYIKRFGKRIAERMAEMSDEDLQRNYDEFPEDRERRKMVGKEIAKRAGGSDTYGNPQTAYGVVYAETRNYTDLAEDVLLQTEQKKAKQNGETEREKDINKARNRINKLKESLPETPFTLEDGTKVTKEDIMNEIRELRSEYLKEFGIKK